MTTLRVAFAIDGTFIGGGHRHVMLLAQGVIKKGGSVFIYVSGNGPFTDELDRLGLKWIQLPMGKCVTPGRLSAWKKALSSLPADILHLHGGVAGLWGRLASPAERSFKIIWTIHGIHYLHHNNLLVKWISLFIDRWLKNKMDMAICVSKADSATALKNGISRFDKTWVIYNGIEVEKFKASYVGPPNWAGPLQVGVVGRLTRMKGQRTALEALEILKTKLPQVRLYFYGTGEDSAMLEDLVSRMNLTGRVFFAGFQDDMPAAFSKLHINLMPSLWEGQPLTLLESLAAGVPTVASNIDCVKEILVAGQECLMVPPQDPESLASAIERLVQDKVLRESLVKNGMAAAGRFNIQSMIDQTVELYAKVRAS